MSTSVQGIRQRLLDQYDRHRRDLPWRRTRDPYAIWVSEVMLQQTRVDTVIPYYLAWMDRFPTVVALAAADQEDVLSVWAGLGYYSRARNLHRAACRVVEVHGGRMPDGVDALRSLPGVGPYTAGAVASIAYDHPEPAVDGNVRRVLCRLMDVERLTAAQAESRAEALLDPHRPGDFNQALMDLGATVCTPRRPRCRACPLARDCRSLAAGTVDARPAPRVRKPVPRRTFEVAVVRERGGRVLLHRRPSEGLLGGLWEFPTAEATPEAGAGDALAGAWPGWAERAGTPAAPGPWAEVGTVRHAFTHFRAEYRAYAALLPACAGRDRGPDVRWVAPDQVSSLALPVAQRKIGALAGLDDAPGAREPQHTGAPSSPDPAASNKRTP